VASGDTGVACVRKEPSRLRSMFGPSNFVPIRYASRKTKNPNMLEACRRAVPAEGFALHSTLATILRRAAIVGGRSPPAPHVIAARERALLATTRKGRRTQQRRASDTSARHAPAWERATQSREFMARKPKSLAGNNKIGCGCSGNASAPPSTALRG
jgi:hypothetical protein